MNGTHDACHILHGVNLHTLDIQDKAYTSLEYDKILQLLSKHTSFSLSRELALSLRPLNDLDGAIRSQRETTEALRVLQLKPDITIGGARDIRSLVTKASLGGVLDPSELLQISDTIAAANSFSRQLGKVLEDADSFSLLSAQLRHIVDLSDLRKQIDSAIDDQAQVRDSASTTLARIRSQLRSAHDRLMQHLNSLISSSSYRDALQEPIITQRDGRYVVPVRADARHRIPGIVHDVSGSGQTLFVEPLATVDMGNRITELRRQESEEIERILAQLSEAVASVASDIMRTLLALARLDFALAKAKFSQHLHACEPELVSAEYEGDKLFLPDARHPLLGRDVVPITIFLGGDFRVLVITGPNTGGKTVALKTTGLLSLMALSGLHLPTSERARVPVLKYILADIGDEQSIEQSLSTFSSHVINIKKMLEVAGPDTLLLLDELGAGTDPEEGAAIAEAIIDYLLEKRALVVATTHYPDIKVYAQTTPGVTNAAVEFDLETLSPTYRLTIGLPGRSYAIDIAQRLGLPKVVIEAAKSRVSPESRAANDLLEQIEAEKKLADQRLAEAEQIRREAEELRSRAAAELQEAERIREQALEEGYQQALRELEDVRREIDEVRRRLSASQAASKLGEIADALRAVENVERRVRKSTRGSKRPSVIRRLPQVGDSVRIKSFGAEGKVLSISDSTAEVQVGSLRSRVPLSDLEVVGGKQSTETSSQTRTRGVRLNVDVRANISTELDLRGMRAEEALSKLDEYLNDAYIQGIPTARIIHGYGTGALRDAVRSMLQGHPLVSGFRPGGPGEGGDGVTVINLISR